MQTLCVYCKIKIPSERSKHNGRIKVQTDRQCEQYNPQAPYKHSMGNMNIGNAYRRARNVLCFEKPHFAVTVQLDNIWIQK